MRGDEVVVGLKNGHYWGLEIERKSGKSCSKERYRKPTIVVFTTINDEVDKKIKSV